MPNATASVTIARPPDVVFAFVADGERGREWRPGVLDIRRISGDGVGARYAQGYHFSPPVDPEKAARFIVAGRIEK